MRCQDSIWRFKRKVQIKKNISLTQSKDTLIVWAKEMNRSNNYRKRIVIWINWFRTTSSFKSIKILFTSHEKLLSLSKSRYQMIEWLIESLKRRYPYWRCNRHRQKRKCKKELIRLLKWEHRNTSIRMNHIKIRCDFLKSKLNSKRDYSWLPKSIARSYKMKTKA